MDKDTDDALEAELQNEADSISLTPYANPTLPPEEAVRLLESCPVCGCRVKFTIFSDFARLLSHEVIRCEECGYRTKKGNMNHLQ